MTTCTFFGHRDTPTDVEPLLRSTLIELIEHKGVDQFYVGNQGTFDRLVKKQLQKLKKDYPHMRYAVVLAYMPVKKKEDDSRREIDTLYPEGLESVPRRYAIFHRNEWMLERSDYVVTYVHRFGGAAIFEEKAKRKDKTVYCLAKEN